MKSLICKDAILLEVLNLRKSRAKFAAQLGGELGGRSMISKDIYDHENGVVWLDLMQEMLSTEVLQKCT